MTNELVIETPTANLRWAVPFDGRQELEPVLQQLWHIHAGETISEEWRDVPRETTYV